LIALLTMVFNEPLFLLQTPVLISLFLLATFTWTLFRPPSMIERYAIMTHGALVPGESDYCRIVTYVWIAFFVVNAAIAESLALWAPMEIWALYAGGIAYVLIGTVFSVEYVVRSVRFRRFGNGPVDRLLARIIGKEPDRG